MAIYTEQTDPNERVLTEKDNIINEINDIIKEYGSFTVADVEADSTPFIEAKGKLTHLMEDFREDEGTVYVYDPHSYTSEQIDEYDEFYEDMHITQLEYILELAQRWAEINEEEW
jgi:hypothetical protein